MINSIKDMGNSSRNKLINNLKKDNDVLFHWCLLIVGHDDDVASIILSKVISLYVTIRGFAFVKSCLEMYKMETEKTLQRKKALRRELCSTSTE